MSAIKNLVDIPFASPSTSSRPGANSRRMTRLFGLKRSHSVTEKINVFSPSISILKKEKSESNGLLNQIGTEENPEMTKKVYFAYVSPSDKLRNLGCRSQIQSKSLDTLGVTTSESKITIVNRFLREMNYPNFEKASLGLSGRSSLEFFNIIRFIGEKLDPRHFTETYKLETNQRNNARLLEKFRDLTLTLAVVTKFHLRIYKSDLMTPMSTKKDLFTTFMLHLITLIPPPRPLPDFFPISNRRRRLLTNQ